MKTLIQNFIIYKDIYIFFIKAVACLDILTCLCLV